MVIVCSLFALVCDTNLWFKLKLQIFTVAGFFIYFVFALVAACKDWPCWSHSCGFILMGRPLYLNYILVSILRNRLTYLNFVNFSLQLCQESCFLRCFFFFYHSGMFLCFIVIIFQFYLLCFSLNVSMDFITFPSNLFSLIIVESLVKSIRGF